MFNSIKTSFFENESSSEYIWARKLKISSQWYDFEVKIWHFFSRSSHFIILGGSHKRKQQTSVSWRSSSFLLVFPPQFHFFPSPDACIGPVKSARGSYCLPPWWDMWYLSGAKHCCQWMIKDDKYWAYSFQCCLQDRRWVAKHKGQEVVLFATEEKHNHLASQQIHSPYSGAYQSGSIQVPLTSCI